MPFPILWGIGAAVVAGVGWYNRKSIGKFLLETGEAYKRRATEEVDNLLSMSLGSANQFIDDTVPGMDMFYWPFFKDELGRRAASSSAAMSLALRAIKVREGSAGGNAG